MVSEGREREEGALDAVETEAARLENPEALEELDGDVD